MFACVLTRATRAPPESYATPDTLLSALTPFHAGDVHGHWSDDRIVMVQALTWNTPTSRHEAVPERCVRTGRIIISWVRLDNREKLCGALALEPRPTLTDPQIILEAHARWGADCANQLEGDFSFVIYDPSTHEAFCARDTMGARPFYYALTDEVFVAATSLPAVRAVNGPVLSVSEKWLALFVANMNWEQTQTAFEGASKLAPAHHMTVTREGASDPVRYFDFDLTSPHATTRDPKWVEQYREMFDRAVRDRARSDYLVGAESSAGLDSSSIAAQLAQVLPHSKDDFHCFGMLLLKDEPALQLATAAMAKIRHTHTLTRPILLGLDENYRRAVRIIGHPPEHVQMIMHPSFFDLSETLGIRTMVSGFGGDEVVTCHAGEMYGDLHAQKAYATLLRELPGNPASRLARFGKRMVRSPQNAFAKAREDVQTRLTRTCLHDDVIAEPGLRADLETWLQPEGAIPDLNAARMLRPEFAHARMARLESAALFAASYRVDYRWPMLDRRLIQQFLSTPAIEKRHRDIGRYLHRRAMVGRIPSQIQWQKTKDMGGHMGGAPEISPRDVTDFADIPAPLQDLLDKQKYQDLVARVGRTDFPETGIDLKSHFTLWQVDQLVDWI